MKAFKRIIERIILIIRGDLVFLPKEFKKYAVNDDFRRATSIPEKIEPDTLPEGFSSWVEFYEANNKGIDTAIERGLDKILYKSDIEPYSSYEFSPLMVKVNVLDEIAVIVTGHGLRIRKPKSYYEIERLKIGNVVRSEWENQIKESQFKNNV